MQENRRCRKVLSTLVFIYEPKGKFDSVYAMKACEIVGL
jgi:hypothetical protein